MFEAIGTLHSFTQQYQLKKSAKQKVETGESFDWKDARSSFVKAQEPRRTASKSFVELSLEKSKKDEDRTAETKKSGIKQKLRRGKKLSPQELEYLRRHDEELYEKAKTTMEEREKLARALKSAKTKAEAQRAVAIAYADAAAALTGKIGGGGAAAGVSSGGGDAFSPGDASGTNADASVNAEGVAAALDAEGAAGTENVSAGTVSAEAAGAITGTESAAADAMGNEADAGHETETDVAQENKDAASTLRQTSEDAEFDDPLILLVLRHLQAEWRDFMKSKQYKEMPEDELQAAKRLDAPQIRQRSEAVKAVSLTAAAAAYQTATEK
ncbi:MAG: hypothetical protein J6Z82_06290 [Schwartzia sp.]|nr:hypothetical protein [Schwartzia sp. (in: firmicutes)]